MTASALTLPPLGLTRDEKHAYTAHYPPDPPIGLRSVTTALNVVAKHYLPAWYAKIAAGWVVDNPQLVLQMLSDLGRDATVKAIAARGKAERDRKGQIGTDAHLAVEYHLNGQPPILTPDTAPLFDQFLRFMAEWKFRPEWSEAMVCSLSMGYAGTFDIYGKLAGKRCLIDVKTGTFMDAAMGIQLAAYGAADFIGRPGSPDRWKLPVIDLYVVLQLQPTFYKLIPYAVGPAELRAFSAALTLDSWERKEGRSIMGQPIQKGMLKIA